MFVGHGYIFEEEAKYETGWKKKAMHHDTPPSYFPYRITKKRRMNRILSTPYYTVLFLRGSSQMVHFSVALSGFSSMHIEHVHFPPLAFLIALDKGVEDALTGAESSNLKANVGGDDLAASAFAFSVRSLVELAGIGPDAGGTKVKKGRDSLSTLRAASLAERYVFSCLEVLGISERTIGWVAGSVSASEADFAGWSKLNLNIFALSSAFLGASMILFLSGES